MKILVANLGSTSFKYKLYEMTGVRGEEIVLAVGAADRIGAQAGESSWEIEVDGKTTEGSCGLADHAAAIALHTEQLISHGVIESAEAIEAIGFKAVHGGPISGAVVVDDQVLATMEDFSDVAPAHNPPYIAAMKSFGEKLPGVPQVAAFETAFHQTIPESRRVYAIPFEWTEKGVKKYGFHGASHRYIATRMGEIAPDQKRVISLHLGGSCSICAIEDGKSVANSFGMTAQSGVFHNNRVGDFDAFALLKILPMCDGNLELAFKRLGKEGGLLGISGVSADLRDVKQAASEGNARAKLAVDAFIETCRHYVGAYLAVLGGADAIVFTGGIGQYNADLREAICDRLGFAGIEIDRDKNSQAPGKAESNIESSASQTSIRVLPTNEELIVGRQTYDALH